MFEFAVHYVFPLPVTVRIKEEVIPFYFIKRLGRCVQPPLAKTRKPHASVNFLRCAARDDLRVMGALSTPPRRRTRNGPPVSVLIFRGDNAIVGWRRLITRRVLRGAQGTFAALFEWNRASPVVVR